MTSKKVPLIQIIKVDEASTSEEVNDLQTVQTGTSGEEAMEQKKKDSKEKRKQLKQSNPTISDTEVDSNATSMPSSSFQSFRSPSTFNSSEYFAISDGSKVTSSSSERTVFENFKKKSSNKKSKAFPAAAAPPEKCSIPLTNPEIFRGAWSELKQRVCSAINTLKGKHEEIISSGPLATSTPVSKASSVKTAKPTASPIKSCSRVSSGSSSSQQSSSPQNVSFKEQVEEETQAMKSQRILEYVLQNIKNHERVSGIKISIEHRFNEIH